MTSNTLPRQYVEMVAAMVAGMVVIGGIRDLAGLGVSFDDRPGASFLLMATDMAIGMAAWMLVRGHGLVPTLEMCAAMYVPGALLPLVSGDVLTPTVFMVVAHLVMLAAMLAVLLRHRGSHASRASRAGDSVGSAG